MILSPKQTEETLLIIFVHKMLGKIWGKYIKNVVRIQYHVKNIMNGLLATKWVVGSQVGQDVISQGIDKCAIPSVRSFLSFMPSQVFFFFLKFSRETFNLIIFPKNLRKLWIFNEISLIYQFSFFIVLHFVFLKLLKQ